MKGKIKLIKKVKNKKKNPLIKISQLLGRLIKKKKK